MFFIDFLAGIGKKLYICSMNWHKKLADRVEIWSLYQLVSLQKSMVFLSVQLEIIVLKERLRGLS